MPSPKDFDTFLAPYAPEVRDIAVAAKSLLEEALPGAAETLDPAANVIGYGYGPGFSRAGVKLGIVRGSEGRTTWFALGRAELSAASR